MSQGHRHKLKSEGVGGGALILEENPGGGGERPSVQTL